MMFTKYMHIERFNTDATEGINQGECFVFPKLDGTNASIWFANGKLQCGSRHYHLTLEQDNGGFFQWALKQDNLIQMVKDYRDLRFYGEWLIPHHIRSYKKDAWNKFYIFDIRMKNDDFMSFEEYKIILDSYQADYIPCIAKLNNPTLEDLTKIANEDHFLIDENINLSSEGIVIKQYGWKNKHNRTVWAKLITSQKDKLKKAIDLSKDESSIETQIVNEYITEHLIHKTIAKINLEQGSFTKKDTPKLAGLVFFDLINEESWNFIKKYKRPIINFRDLEKCCNNRIKELKPELFEQ